jgi:hypothetical protein
MSEQSQALTSTAELKLLPIENILKFLSKVSGFVFNFCVSVLIVLNSLFQFLRS